MTRVVEVGLLWHSDVSGNLGVGALTAGNVALVRRAADRADVTPRFHLFQSADVGEPYFRDVFASRHGITGRYMVSPFGYWRDVGRLDLMLDIGAGDSFTDIYSNRRFTYLAATKYLALARRVPLVLSPQTIGPFSRQPHTDIARDLLTRARAVFARDPLSFDAARELAPSAKVVRTVDVAFALPFERRPKGPGIRFGLGISGLLYSGGYSGNNQFGLQADYPSLMHQLIEALLARGDTGIELICHVNAPHLPNDDDMTAALKLKERYPTLAMAPRFTSPSDAKSYISGLDFLAAARMHATIAAYSSGVPVVPISYSRKFEGLFGGIGYDHVLPVKGLTTEQAVQFILDRFDMRDQLAADIAYGTPAVEAGLETYVTTLADLLREAAR